MNMFRTNVSTTEDEISDCDGGDAIGGGTGTGTGKGKGTPRGKDSSDGIDAIGTSSCFDVMDDDRDGGGQVRRH